MKPEDDFVRHDPGVEEGIQGMLIRMSFILSINTGGTHRALEAQRPHKTKVEACNGGSLVSLIFSD